MTWSIIARDPQSGAFGVAVASKFFAVGAICPHGEGGVDALSTQALPNPLWGYRGMRLLREGMPAQSIIAHITTPDAGAAQRQFHVHDNKGGIDWCGHVVRPGISVAGNMLAGPGNKTTDHQAYIFAYRAKLEGYKQAPDGIIRPQDVKIGK